MAEKILGKLVFWMIPIIALIILALVYFGPAGMFLRLTGISSNLTNISGLDEDQLPSIQPTIPEKHRIAINRMVDTIRNNMLAETANNCFENYLDLGESQNPISGLPLLEEEGTSIVIRASPMETRVRVYTGPENQRQLVDSYRISGMQPCVIGGPSSAGDGAISNYFYYQFLNPNPGRSGLQYYNDNVNEIRIYSDGDSNRIRYDNIDAEFNDQGWLFSAGNGKVCFFPTINEGEDCEDSAFEEDDLEDLQKGIHQKCMAKLYYNQLDRAINICGDLSGP